MSCMIIYLQLLSSALLPMFLFVGDFLLLGKNWVVRFVLWILLLKFGWIFAGIKQHIFWVKCLSEVPSWYPLEIWHSHIAIENGPTLQLIYVWWWFSIVWGMFTRGCIPLICHEITIVPLKTLNPIINGNSRILKWSYPPYIRPM